MSYTPVLESCAVSEGNSSNTPLGSGQIFVGIMEDIRQFAEVSFSIYAEPFNATGTVYFEFSPDGLNWDISIPIIIKDPTAFISFPLRVVLPFYRARYENGGVDQTIFRFTTIFNRIGAKNLTRTPTQIIGSAEPVEVVRALIEPSLGASRKYFLAADRSIFGMGVVGCRISQISARFDSPIENSNVYSTITGTGIILQGNGQTIISTGTDLTSSVKLQTSKSIKYTPGRELYAIFTAWFTTPTNINAHQRIGLYDDNNGFFIGYHGMDFGITVRSFGSDQFIPKGSLDGDPLDGSANSQFTKDDIQQVIDFTKYNIYRIRFGWLGSAPVFFEVMAPDGNWVNLHLLNRPNSSNVPHITSPDLPIRMEIIKNGSDITNLQMGTGSWDAGIVDAPNSIAIEEMKGRTSFDDNVSEVTISSIIRSVPSGRLCRLKTLYISVRNNSMTGGQLNITDGVGGSVKVPFTVPLRAGTEDGYISQMIKFDQALDFNSSIYAVVVSGIMTYSIFVSGYDEGI